MNLLSLEASTVGIKITQSFFFFDQFAACLLKATVSVVTSIAHLAGFREFFFFKSVDQIHFRLEF